MARALAVASWNVEHFRNEGSRVADVVAFLKLQNPDVFALYEVEGKEVFGALTAAMPGFSFHITEGPQVQEILVGAKSDLTAFFTQKVEFKSGVSLLRPGSLLTVTVEGKDYPLLFLHTKSDNDPRGMGLRDDMLVRAVDFRKVLDQAAGGNANYIFLGDLNTMGMQYTFVREHDIPPESELEKLRRKAGRRGMRPLSKNADATWWGGGATPPSDLDHVVAAEHLEFQKFNGAEVDVRGWPELEGEAAQREWIHRHSDHALLYFEVQNR